MINNKLTKFFITLTFIFLQNVKAQDQLKSSSSVDGDGSILFKFEMDRSLGILQHVKFIVYLSEDKTPVKLVFQNTQTYPFHSDYLVTTKEFTGMSREQIDNLTVKNSPDRKAILGTLFSHLQSGQDKDNIINNSFELVTEEVVPVKTVKAISQLLALSSPGTIEEKSFAYLASGKNKKEILEQTELFKLAGIKIYDAFKNNNFSAYVQGWNVGVIKVVPVAQFDEALRSGEITADTILVVDQVPREIPPVKGLISVEPTASSSHVALLAQMFKIPFAADRKIMDQASNLNGQKVYLSIGASKIKRLTSIDDETYERLSRVKNFKPLQISVDFTKTKIVPTATLKDIDIPAYGGKAVRLGLIKQSIPDNSPEYSVAIPVAYFQKFLGTARADGTILKDVIDTHLKTISAGQLNYAEIAAQLAQIRDAMKETVVPESLVQEIRFQIGKYVPANIKRIKMRSSSNVEDGAEFNGAGLYDSEGVWLNGAPVEKENDFERGLNKVWRSFYSDRGFLARQAFKVDESKAAMGILVQETFKNELANGVALWQPPRSEWDEDSIKAIGFAGEDKTVTNPNSADQPEIAIINGNRDTTVNSPTINWNVNIDQKTNLLPIGQRVLSDEYYQQLASLISTVVQKWPGEKPTAGLDFEWKLIQRNGQKQILLKQVRPLVNEQKDQLPNNANFFIIGGFEEELETDYPENDAAYAQHFCPEKVKVTLPSFTDVELKNSLKIPNLKITLRGKDYEFKDIPAAGTTKIDDGHPEFSLDFAVDTDVYKGIRFSFINPYAAEGGQVLDAYRATVRGSEKDLAMAQPFFPAIDRYNCTLSTSFDYANDVPIDDPYVHLNAVIKTKDGSIALKGEYKLKSGFDKTIHHTITETVVTGFGLKSAGKITARQASVYTAGHHNFFWGLSVDMSALEIPEADKQELIKKFGRYFLFSTSALNKKNQGAAWMKSDGQISKPFKATWEAKNQ